MGNRSPLAGHSGKNQPATASHLNPGNLRLCGAVGPSWPAAVFWKAASVSASRAVFCSENNRGWVKIVLCRPSIHRDTSLGRHYPPSQAEHKRSKLWGFPEQLKQASMQRMTQPDLPRRWLLACLLVITVTACADMSRNQTEKAIDAGAPLSTSASDLASAKIEADEVGEAEAIKYSGTDLVGGTATGPGTGAVRRGCCHP